MGKDTEFSFDDKDSHSLEKNHTHFLLLDDGKYHSEYLYNEMNELNTPDILRLSESYDDNDQCQKGLLTINI